MPLADVDEVEQQCLMYYLCTAWCRTMHSIMFVTLRDPILLVSVNLVDLITSSHRVECRCCLSCIIYKSFSVQIVKQECIAVSYQ